MLHTVEELYPELLRWPQATHSRASILNGNPHQEERDSLIQLVEWSKARTVFEFGTFNGATAAALAAIPTVEQVWTLDIPAGVKAALPMLEIDLSYIGFDPRLTLPANRKIMRLWGDSAMFDFSPYYGRCDVVWVMGAHSLPYCRNDLAQAFNLVSAGGLVVWHAGTPEPVATIAQEYDVYLMPVGGRMAIVKQLSSTSQVVSQERYAHV